MLIAQLEYYPSLDLQVDDQQESHYIGAGSFLDFTPPIRPEGDLGETLSSSPMHDGHQHRPVTSSSYHQVSRDDQAMAYFVRNPAFVYGKTSKTVELHNAIQATLGPVQMEALLER